MVRTFTQLLFLSCLTQVAAFITSGDITEDEAVNYLKQWRPKEDRVTEAFFRSNAEYALKTQDLPFTKQVSKSMFLQYVLPYSHFDEARDSWRPHMYEMLRSTVKDKETLEDASKAILANWANAFGKPLEFKSNMTPQVMAPLTETLKKGYASCTGMSIFLADCLRAVGIPARVVGVAEWNRPDGGNHNWVEIWMGDHWNYVDADPGMTSVTWNHTWFTEQAKLQSSVPKSHAIMASLWGPDASSVYTMSWRTPPQFVPGIDLTANYAPLNATSYRSSAESAYFMPTGVLLSFAFVALLGGAFHYYKGKQQGYERLP